MWGGKGCGAPCDFCRVRVTPSEVEYEVEAKLDDEIMMLHFHPRCHDAWKSGQDPMSPLGERVDSESPESPPPTAA
jgi:hypothetical protein